MIKDFETYIAEGRMGKLIDASKQEKVRKEDELSPFFGTDKEWMLYTADGRNRFKLEELPEILNQMKDAGWRLADVDDFIESFHMSRSKRYDVYAEKNRILNLKQTAANLSKDFFVMNTGLDNHIEKSGADHIYRIFSKYGTLELPAYEEMSKYISGAKFYECNILVTANDKLGKAVYINDNGFCGMSYTPISDEQMSYIILIRDKK